MNSISCIVDKVLQSGKVYQIELNGGGLLFKVLILESDLAHSPPGSTVNLLFKETEVSIGLNPHLEISLSNRIPGVISSVDKGELLSRVVLHTTVGEIHSIITSQSVDRLKLAEGMDAVAYIKRNHELVPDHTYP